MNFYNAFTFGILFEGLSQITKERIDFLKRIPEKKTNEDFWEKIYVYFWKSNVDSLLITLKMWKISLETQSELKESLNTYLGLFAESNPMKSIIQFLETQLERFPIWKDRIEKELSNIYLVVITNETNLNLVKLIESPESFFKPKIWEKLSDLQKGDFKDAAKCISVQAWTPAAMITMRFIESAVRKFYIDKTTNDPSGKVWGILLQELRTTTGVDQKLIGYFDYLKDFRNDLQHPVDRFSQDETEGAFQHAIYIINQIYS